MPAPRHSPRPGPSPQTKAKADLPHLCPWAASGPSFLLAVAAQRWLLHLATRGSPAQKQCVSVCVASGALDHGGGREAASAVLVHGP